MAFNEDVQEMRMGYGMDMYGPYGIFPYISHGI